MCNAVQYFKKKGVTHFIFGDIFLHDVKKYREDQLNPYGIEVVEPLWDKTSEEVINDFLQSGLRTKIVITQADKLDSSFIGRELDESFIKSLPKDVDYCGENGEYHTLVYAGPIFKNQVYFTLSTPYITTYDVKLEDGTIKTFSYWHADIETNNISGL